MSIKLRWVVLLLTGILTVSMGITAFTYTDTGTEADFSVTAATFPVYTIALNVVGDTAGVTVSCLIQPTAGCNHDYQLSPSEMQTVAASDVILRGDGDEFLDAVLAGVPEVTQIVTVKEGERLPSCEENHHHGEAEHSHEENHHSWVDPIRYARQVEAVRDGLCAVDPEHAESYRRNAAAYLAAVETVAEGWDTLSADGTVLFHQSMAYAAEFLHLPVLATVPLGEESGVSAADLTAAAGAVSGKTVVLLYDAQITRESFGLEAYAARTVTMVWDTAVVPQPGVSPKIAWLWAMEQNRQRWEEAVA